MRFSQRSSLRGRRYLPRGATPGSETAASVSGQLQCLRLQVGFLPFDRNVGLMLRVSPLISQTCSRAFQMQFTSGRFSPEGLTSSRLTFSRNDCFSLAYTSLRFGKNSPFLIAVSPVLLQLEPRFLALFALVRFRATRFALSSPTAFRTESDDSWVWSWSSFIFQLPIGIPVRPERFTWLKP